MANKKDRNLLNKIAFVAYILSTIGLVFTILLSVKEQQEFLQNPIIDFNSDQNLFVWQYIKEFEKIRRIVATSKISELSLRADIFATKLYFLEHVSDKRLSNVMPQIIKQTQHIYEELQGTKSDLIEIDKKLQELQPLIYEMESIVRQSDAENLNNLLVKQQQIYLLLIIIGIIAGSLVTITAYLFIKQYNSSEELQKLIDLANQHAENTIALQNEFISTVSHEIRTPLHIIVSMLDLYIPLLNISPEQQDTFIKPVKESVAQLTSIIDDVMLYAKLNTNSKDMIKLKPLILGRSLIIWFNSFKIKIKPEIDYDFDIDTSIQNFSFMLDENRIRQIVFNLLSNAIKFTEQGYIKLKFFSENNILHIIVKDSGIGIPKGRAIYLFDPFYQAHGSMNRPNEGIGLGLAISKRLAVLMGGDLTYGENPSGGSIFELTLPRNDHGNDHYINSSNVFG